MSSVVTVVFAVCVGSVVCVDGFELRGSAFIIWAVFYIMWCFMFIRLFSRGDFLISSEWSCCFIRVLSSVYCSCSIAG